MYQDVNNVTIKSVTVNAGELTAPKTYIAKGDTQLIQSKTNASAVALLLFDSGSEINATNDHGS